MRNGKHAKNKYKKLYSAEVVHAISAPHAGALDQSANLNYDESCLKNLMESCHIDIFMKII